MVKTSLHSTGAAPRTRIRSLLAFAVVSVGACAPRPSETGDTVTILAYNIHHGEGMDSVIDLDRIADLILEADPDLVTLQEVDSVAERTGGVDQARVLGELTGMHAAFGRFMEYQGGAYGMAVLSRWPMESITNWRLSDGEEPRTALGITVRTPGDQELVLVGIHFYRTEEERLSQAADLERFLQTETSPVVLAGDFNSLPDSDVIRRLEAGWTVLQKGEDRLTFPSWAPEREIDFVLLRPAERFEVVRHRPLNEPVISDHRPVLTEVVLRRAGQE